MKKLLYLFVSFLLFGSNLYSQNNEVGKKLKQVQYNLEKAENLTYVYSEYQNKLVSIPYYKNTKFREGKEYYKKCLDAENKRRQILEKMLSVCNQAKAIFKSTINLIEGINTEGESLEVRAGVEEELNIVKQLYLIMVNSIYEISFSIKTVKSNIKQLNNLLKN